MSPLVSILMPAYNHERYVADAIRSVADQDWPRIELIVVDDGSTDGTWEVLQRLKRAYARRFERFVVERQGNRGVGATENRLHELARGEFVGVIASDDQYLPGAVPAMAAKLLGDPGLGLVVGQNELMDGEGLPCGWDAGQNIAYDLSTAAYRTFNDYLAGTTGVSGDDPGFGTYAELVRHNHVPNGWLIRKSCWDRIGPFVPEAPLEDHWLMLQLAKIARMAMIETRTFRYRWHAANTIRQRERMIDFASRTMRWEEETIVRRRDHAAVDAYLAEWGRLRDERRIGAVFRFARYRTRFASLKILELFGLRLYVRKSMV